MSQTIRIAKPDWKNRVHHQNKIFFDKGFAHLIIEKDSQQQYVVKCYPVTKLNGKNHAPQEVIDNINALIAGLRDAEVSFSMASNQVYQTDKLMFVVTGWEDVDDDTVQAYREIKALENNTTEAVM